MRCCRKCKYRSKMKKASIIKYTSIAKLYSFYYIFHHCFRLLNSHFACCLALRLLLAQAWYICQCFCEPLKTSKKAILLFVKSIHGSMESRLFSKGHFTTEGRKTCLIALRRDYANFRPSSKAPVCHNEA